jgi:Ca2+-binding RTX toxin-like protein
MRARNVASLVAALAAVTLTPAAGAAAQDDDELAHPLCSQSRPSDKCQDGGGRRVAGGGEKVSHAGWPAITGVFWQVMDNPGDAFTGGADNDELLGHHGSDRIRGAGGHDVLWGDWDPKGNNESQRDVLDGQNGNDWIYSSHGKNTIDGGAGKDYIWAYYGRGTIDCGAGFDTLRIKLDNNYTYKSCERIKNFCSFGSKPGNQGGCYKPGEKPKAARGAARRSR